MKMPETANRARNSAEKLQREAQNWLNLVVSERSTPFAEDLIEEALMLMRRARELSTV